MKPIGPWIMVKEIKKDTKTINGIEYVEDEKLYTKAVVIKLGTGINLINSDKPFFNVKEGDEVYIKNFSGITLEHDQEDYIFCYESDILCKIEE